MLIRKTLPEDVDTILNIFDTARQFMHATGNPTQWNANYPALEDLEPDIQNGNSYFFGYSIVEYAIKNNIDKVYYQTREGETFIKIHELIKRNNPFGVELPDCDTIEVSRMGTFSASLKVPVQPDTT